VVTAQGLEMVKMGRRIQEEEEVPVVLKLMVFYQTEVQAS
jgi:hypothetical protein